MVEVAAEKTMRTLRLIIAALVATSLSILPVSAAMAMTHAGKAEMGVSASVKVCSCCDAARKCRAGQCVLSCSNASAVLTEGPTLAKPALGPLAGKGWEQLTPFQPEPQPPPPKS
jgi:hypothetical protein